MRRYVNSYKKNEYMSIFSILWLLGLVLLSNINTQKKEIYISW